MGCPFHLGMHGSILIHSSEFAYCLLIACLLLAYCSLIVCLLFAYCLLSLLGGRICQMRSHHNPRGRTAEALDPPHLIPPHPPKLYGANLRPGRELENLVHDVEARGHLPGEQREVDAVEEDVQVARGLVPLLHLAREAGSQRPQHRDASAREQVGPREELARTHPRVHPALHRDENPDSQKDVAPVGVPVLEVAGDKLLALHGEGVDLLLDLGGGDGLGLPAGGHHALDRCLELRDLIPHGAHAAPVPAEPARPRGAHEEYGHDRRVDERDGAALQDTEVPRGVREGHTGHHQHRRDSRAESEGEVLERGELLGDG
mmetsp:Transcript_10433/g.33724  ORF Transcript_10433/g.33724 Transcript_10433/m.33724 type:complete len:317 (-) Transcript_10433:427-1377(-)